MTQSGIRVRARISLLPIKEVPIRGSYRPNHNFGDPGDREMTIGFINFPEGQCLRPGETTEIELTFWDRPRLAADIYPGREWRIQEGPKLVGIGTVLEVIG